MKLFCSKCQKVFEAEKPADSSTVKCPLCGGTQEFPETVPGPGVVVGDFLIEKLLSRGGMGEVFLAKQISLDRPVALKVLQQKHMDDKEYVESLFKEARAAAKLSHPNIVQAYAVGEENGIFYFAMEYVRGETFKQILKKEKTIEFTRAATVIRDIARAIGAAWREQKLVHQDIKPDNIMLDANGFAKLSDLGLAKVATGVPDDSGDDDKVLGTPQYISPEQLTGVPTDIRSDIYSLGATFYHFVTGRFPYVAKTGDEIARMHIESALQPPREVNPKLPEKLNRIIIKMMEKDINKRYQSAEELIGDLDEYLRSAPQVPVAKKSEPQKTASPATTKPVLSVPAPKKAAPPKLSVPGKKPVAKPIPPAATEKPLPATAAETAASPAAAKVDEPERKAPDIGEAAEKSPWLARVLKITLISVVSILLLAIIAVAAMVIGVKTDSLPEGEIRSFAVTVAGWFGVASPGGGATGEAVAVKRVGGGKKENSKSEPVRSAAVVECERIIALPIGDPAQKMDFLHQAELQLAKGGSKDAAERAAYGKLREKFAAVDEEMRFSPYRERRARVRDNILAERRREQEEKRRLRERREREEREYRAQQARQKRLREEEEARFRQAEAERRKRKENAAFNELKKEIDRATKLLIDGFYAAADGDERALSKAMNAADGIYIRNGDNERERELIRDYREFRRQLPKELSAFRSFRDTVRNIKNEIPCGIPGEGMCLVVALYPDGSADVTNRRSQRRHIPADVLARSRNFKKSFAENMKDKYPGALFYYALMLRRFDPEAVKNAPKGFWKKYVGWFADAAR